MTREITGRHVLIGTVTAFGLIVGVNLTMAFMAVGTFPGLEVKNSYVASQSFDARRAAQEALGWNVTATVENGVLRLGFTDADGSPVQPEGLTALIGRPTIARDDLTLALEREGSGFRAPVDLGSGAWVLKLDAQSGDGTAFAKRLELWVR